MNPIERMREVADLLISQRRYRESYTIYDELYRQMWSVFGTVQSGLTGGPGAYAEPAASVLCARMYGINLSLALDEFIRILCGHLQCISWSREVGAEIPRDAVLSEFLVLTTLAVQPIQQRKITPVFAVVTAVVDRDHRFRRIWSAYSRGTVEKHLIEHAQQKSNGEIKAITHLLLDYLITRGEASSDFVRRLTSIAGPYTHRWHSRHYQSDRQEWHQRHEPRAKSDSKSFDATAATEEEKQKYYGRLFGLQGRVTKADIRSQYLHSVSLYHPDKVQHLGPELKELAEEKTKELNAAYDWLKGKYQI